MNRSLLLIQECPPPLKGVGGGDGLSGSVGACGTLPRPSGEAFSFKLHQRRAIADLFAGGVAEGFDGAGGGGGDGVFHFHRFEDQQRRAF